MLFEQIKNSVVSLDFQAKTNLHSFPRSTQTVLRFSEFSLQVLHSQTVTQSFPLGHLKTRLCNLLFSTNKPLMEEQNQKL